MSTYLIIILAYLVALTVLNFIRSRRIKSQEQFMVAGRSLKWQVMVFTLICTWIGSGTFISGAEFASKAGFSALWLAGGAWVGIILIYFLAAKIHTFGQYTVGDELVGDDGDEGQDERDGPEDACGRAVADLEDVADRILAEGMDLGGQEVDEDDPDPGPAGQPQGGESGLRGELGAADEGPGADPGADQGEDHDLPLETPPGDHELFLALDPPRTDEIEDRQGDEVREDDDEVGRHPPSFAPG